MFAGIGYRYLYNDTYKHTVQLVTDQLTQSAYIADGYVESIRQSLLRSPQNMPSPGKQQALPAMTNCALRPVLIS